MTQILSPVQFRPEVTNTQRMSSKGKERNDGSNHLPGKLKLEPKDIAKQIKKEPKDRKQAITDSGKAMPDSGAPPKVSFAPKNDSLPTIKTSFKTTQEHSPDKKEKKVCLLV